MNLEITKRNKKDLKPKPADDGQLGFGRFFSDHFFHMKHNSRDNWHDAKIEPYSSLELDPSALIFHYCQQVFEGLKAYSGHDNGIYLFRPEKNFERLNRSAKRLCMPEVDIDFVMKGLKQLILLEQDWIPKSSGSSIYIRPTMIATEGSLGVKVSSEYLFYIIIGPVGAYYPEGFSPVKIYVSDKYVRAIRGGIGNQKTGGNYAASLLAFEEAKHMGYSQVLWLDANERKYVEEVGTSNIFFLIGGTMVTPELSGSILPGVTRDSVIRIVKDWGIKLEERQIDISEVITGAENGSLKEAFGTGTAAIISPIKELFYRDATYRIGNGNAGELSQRLYDELLMLQYGKKEDPYGWVERIN